MKQYKDHRVVLITHSYLNAKSERIAGKPRWFTYEPYAINNKIQKSPEVELPAANSGEQIWQKLVYPSHNIEMVLCGHISGHGFRTDNNAVDRSVHHMLFDTQSEGGAP